MRSKIFTYPVLIKECHIDFLGHVNNAVYLTLFEEARWDFVTRNGFGVKKIQELGLGPVILEIKLLFLREIHLRDEVEIITQLTSCQKKICKFSQEIKRKDDVCCNAEFTIALFDLKTRKIIIPPLEWLSAIGYEGD